MMEKSSRLTLATVAVIVVALTSGALAQGVVEVQAVTTGQGNGQEVRIGIIAGEGPNGPVQIFNSNNGRFIPGRPGSLGGPGGMGPRGTMMTIPNFIDPSRSYIKTLLNRADVRKELALTEEQIKALDGNEKAAQKIQQDRVTQSADQIKQALEQSKASGANALDAIKLQTQQMQAEMRNVREMQDKKLAEVLTEPQMKRIKEIDLQYRGPLAMGTKKVNEQVNLDEERFKKIEKNLQDYLSAVFPGKVSFANGTTSITMTVDSRNPGGQQKQKSEQEIEALRKTLGLRSLDTLTPEQFKTWKEVKGPTFVFLSKDAPRGR